MRKQTGEVQYEETVSGSFFASSIGSAQGPCPVGRTVTGKAGTTRACYLQPLGLRHSPICVIRRYSLSHSRIHSLGHWKRPKNENGTLDYWVQGALGGVRSVARSGSCVTRLAAARTSPPGPSKGSHSNY
jgi:hypothetical protein